MDMNSNSESILMNVVYQFFSPDDMRAYHLSGERDLGSHNQLIPIKIRHYIGPTVRMILQTLVTSRRLRYALPHNIGILLTHIGTIPTCV